MMSSGPTHLHALTESLHKVDGLLLLSEVKFILGNPLNLTKHPARQQLIRDSECMSSKQL